MALEAANYIDGLVATNPPGSDQASTADDHLRLLKSVLKNTFPNINGAVNATPAQLNGLFSLANSRAMVSNASGVPTTSAVTSTELGYLSGVTSAIQTQFSNHDHSTGTQVPTGGIADLAVTAAKIAADTITGAKIDWANSAGLGIFTPTSASLASVAVFTVANYFMIYVPPNANSLEYSGLGSSSGGTDTCYWRMKTDTNTGSTISGSCDSTISADFATPGVLDVSDKSGWTMITIEGYSATGTTTITYRTSCRFI